MRGYRESSGPDSRTAHEAAGWEHDVPTLGVIRDAELRQMAAEGVVLGTVCGVPVKLRSGPRGLLERPSPRLPIWAWGVIRIDADVRGHPLGELAQWLLEGPAQGRGSPEQLLDDARKLNHLSGKAYLLANRRVAASLMARSLSPRVGPSSFCDEKAKHETHGTYPQSSVPSPQNLRAQDLCPTKSPRPDRGMHTQQRPQSHGTVPPREGMRRGSAGLEEDR